METFNEIINGDKPVLVDFFATWCGPCKTMHPIIEEISEELQGSAHVLEIDVDENQEAISKFQIQAVPTLIIFKNGEAVWRSAGVIDKTSLTQQVQCFVN